MREIPMSYIKSNQAGIVLFVVLSILLSQPWLLAALWAIQVAGVLTQGRGNLFVLIAKPFLKPQGKETQAAELTRFNNTLAVLFLTLSLLGFAIGWSVAGYVFSAMLIAAAGAALLGYCIGCTIYYQYKQFKARRKIKMSR
ncbi:DUF4395 domain-containing protein [Cohnella nanjingensis]|uniref:DUF4395 domain-containing protein n=1 Tax=Cohnella nanjingensis TaxID=1387779 RepID=A0A7X0RXP8_9BACL|nr:DUF4395 domain-containing protein [Cohnella nanjingensis]MBB6675591.1 DUF4395 domain-containing protein [Cohnella nanjingensis]